MSTKKTKPLLERMAEKRMANSFIVTGYSLRAPKCSNVPEFARALAEQRDLTTETAHGKREGRLNQLDVDSCKDNADFFGVNDETHCLFYQVMYEAVLDAGIRIQDLENDSTTGVYIVVDNGQCSSNTTDNDPPHIAKQICDHWKICGPCFTFDIHVDLCSPLKALDRAVKDLHSRNVKRAIVGAVSLISSSRRTQQNISPTGHCHSFDNRADGVCIAEGVACIVLERGPNNGHAFVCGVGSTADKSSNLMKESHTIPPQNKQIAFLKTVFNRTGVVPCQVVYHEAHGAGTLDEERSEVDALLSAYGEDADRAHRLRIGCVKSNLGDAGAASGLVGLVKILVSFEDQKLYPNYGFEQSTHRGIQNGNLCVVTKPTDFKNGLCAISSFGPGGANALAILAMPSKRKTWNTSRGHVYPFAACPTLPPNEKHDLFYALHEELGNSSMFPYRWNDCFWKKSKPLAFVFSGQGSQWNYMGHDLMKSSRVFRQTIVRLEQETGLPLVSLYEDGTKWQIKENAFIGIVSFQLGVLSILKDAGITPSYFLGHNLGEAVCGYLAGFLSEKEAMLQAKIYSELFAVVDPNYRLDVYPTEPRNYDYLLEVPSLDSKYYYVKKVPEDSAIDVDKVMQSYSMYGKMIVVGCEARIIEQAIAELQLEGTCVIGCHNTNNNKTVSGPEDDINILEKFLKAEHPKLFIKDLPTDNVAFHAPYLKMFKHFLKSECIKMLGTIPCGPLPTSWISTSGQTMFSSEYIVDNICNPVTFYQAIEKLPPDCMVLEIGPGSGLCPLIKRTRPDLERKALFEIHKPFENDNFLENLHHWAMKGMLNSSPSFSSAIPVHYEERYPTLWASKGSSVFVSDHRANLTHSDPDIDKQESLVSKRKRNAVGFLKKLGQTPQNTIEKLKHLGTSPSQNISDQAKQNEVHGKSPTTIPRAQPKSPHTQIATISREALSPSRKERFALLAPSWEPYNGPEVQLDKRISQPSSKSASLTQEGRNMHNEITGCVDLPRKSFSETENNALTSPLSPMAGFDSQDSSMGLVGCLSPLSSCSGSRPNHLLLSPHSKISDENRYEAENIYEAESRSPRSLDTEHRKNFPLPCSHSSPAKSNSTDTFSDSFSNLSPYSGTGSLGYMESWSPRAGKSGIISSKADMEHEKLDKEEFSVREAHSNELSLPNVSRSVNEKYENVNQRIVRNKHKETEEMVTTATKWSTERTYAAAALAAAANWWIIAILALSNVNKPNVLGYAFNTFVASLAVYLLVRHSASLESISVQSTPIFTHFLLGAMSFLVYFIMACISVSAFASHVYSILIGFYSFDSLAIIIHWEDIPADFRNHCAIQHTIMFFASGIWASISNQWPSSVSIGVCVWLTAELWHCLLNIYRQCRDYRMDMNLQALYYLQLSIFGAERFQRLAAYVLIASGFRTSTLAIVMFASMLLVDAIDCSYKWSFIQNFPPGSPALASNENVEVTSREDDGDIEVGKSPISSVAEGEI